MIYRKDELPIEDIPSAAASEKAEVRSVGDYEEKIVLRQWRSGLVRKK